MYEVCMSADSRVEPDFSQEPQKWIGDPPASLGVECLMYEETDTSSTSSLLIKSGFVILFSISVYAGYQVIKQGSANQQLVNNELNVETTSGATSKGIGQQITELENQAKEIRTIDMTTTGSVKKAPQPADKIVPVTPETSTDAKFHVVQPGDTLSAIGRKFQIKTSEIMKLNAIENPRRIKPGMKLIVSN